MLIKASLPALAGPAPLPGAGGEETSHEVPGLLALTLQHEDGHKNR